MAHFEFPKKTKDELLLPRRVREKLYHQRHEEDLIKNNIRMKNLAINSLKNKRILCPTEDQIKDEIKKMR